jgi:Cytochrome P460
MKLRVAVPIGAVLTIVAIGLSQSRAQRGPVFKQDGSLVLPTGFREWVFLGGPVTPNALNNGKALFPEFHNVYVEPENYRYFQQHGMFPDGTVLVKELVLTETGTHPDGSSDSASGRGYFPSSLHGADVMVKDSKRFANTHNWGFFTFGHQAPPYQPTASVSPAGECASCHIAGVSKTDMVWVQYYPSLTTKTE